MPVGTPRHTLSGPGAILLSLVISVTSMAAEQSTPPAQDTQSEYKTLIVKIASGQANLVEVRQALTDKDVGRLTNIVHALVSMRWHRAVNNLLLDMWYLNTAKYPELSWDLIRNPPVRIALASTISRIQMADTGEYLDYMRAHENNNHEFVRAQVVIGLGLNGYKEDVPYIKAMAGGDNRYVAQSAITALGLMNSNPARDALEELWLKTRGTPKQKLIGEVLQQAYGVTPKQRTKARPEEKKTTEQK